MNLIEGIQEECNRLREIRTHYEKIGDAGKFGIAMIDLEIKNAEKAMAEGDAILMIQSLKGLQGISD